MEGEIAFQARSHSRHVADRRRAELGTCAKCHTEWSVTCSAIHSVGLFACVPHAQESKGEDISKGKGSTRL